jgi:hypothetical protein
LHQWGGFTNSSKLLLNATAVVDDDVQPVIKRPSLDVDRDRVVSVHNTNRVRNPPPATRTIIKSFATALQPFKRNTSASQSCKPATVAKRSKNNAAKGAKSATQSSISKAKPDGKQRPASMLFKPSTSTSSTTNDQFALFKDTQLLRNALSNLDEPNKRPKTTKPRRRKAGMQPKRGRALAENSIPAVSSQDQETMSED